MGRYTEISFPGLGIDSFKMNGVALSFEIGGKPITVMWYGIIICCAILTAFAYLAYRAKQGGLVFDDVLDITLVTVCVAVVGTRLYYVIFDGLENYIVTEYGFWKNLGKSLYNIIAIWEGGLAIYGGIISGTLTVLVMSRIKKISFFKIADMATPGIMIAQAIGRWGNFTNGEAFGSETTLPWRMGINNYNTGYMTLYVHPTFFYESLWNVIGFTLINVFYKKRKFEGEVCFWYFIWYGLGRTFIEMLRTDSLMLGPIRVSSMLAALIVLTLLPLLIFLRIREHKLSTAGMISENTLPSVLFLLKTRNVQECSTNTKNTNAEETSAESEETTNG
jgi:phosphatidylglycerol:prolipoprotein diacylglycerol transferase